MQYSRRGDGGRTTSQSKNDTLIGKNPLLTLLQGLKSTIMYLKTKTLDLSCINEGIKVI